MVPVGSSLEGITHQTERHADRTLVVAAGAEVVGVAPDPGGPGGQRHRDEREAGGLPLLWLAGEPGGPDKAAGNRIPMS